MFTKCRISVHATDCTPGLDGLWAATAYILLANMRHLADAGLMLGQR